MREEKTMNLSKLRRRALYLAASAVITLAGAVSVRSAEAVTTTVTAVAKKGSPPSVKREDIQVHQGKERVQVSDWRQSDKLFVAILIDDSLSSEAASQWSDLKAFINAQPPSTYVAVAYARNGAAMVAQDFTQDHALAAKALRIPIGGLGAFSSPYLSVQDWMKCWPEGGGERRSLILISSGIDYFRGGFDPIDPDLESTIERAQKQNVNLWTIYYPGEGHISRGYFRLFNAQMNLSKLSEETGAESYYLGVERPVSLKSYFDEIQEHLNNQYLLTFQTSASGGKKGKFERVRVTSELPHVEFLVPSEVFLPPSE
jgi:VWFA-related protein